MLEWACHSTFRPPIAVDLSGVLLEIAGRPRPQNLHIRAKTNGVRELRWPGTLVRVRAGLPRDFFGDAERCRQEGIEPI